MLSSSSASLWFVVSGELRRLSWSSLPSFLPTIKQSHTLTHSYLDLIIETRERERGEEKERKESRGSFVPQQTPPPYSSSFQKAPSTLFYSSLSLATVCIRIVQCVECTYVHTFKHTHTHKREIDVDLFHLLSSCSSLCHLPQNHPMPPPKCVYPPSAGWVQPLCVWGEPGAAAAAAAAAACLLPSSCFSALCFTISSLAAALQMGSHSSRHFGHVSVCPYLLHTTTPQNRKLLHRLG